MGLIAFGLVRSSSRRPARCEKLRAKDIDLNLYPAAPQAVNARVRYKLAVLSNETAIPRSANKSSTSRRLNVNRRQSQIDC